MSILSRFFQSRYSLKSRSAVYFVIFISFLIVFDQNIQNNKQLYTLHKHYANHEHPPMLRCIEKKCDKKFIYLL